LPELGIGFNDTPVPDNLYGLDYFEHYRMLDRTETGARLTAARLSMVTRHYEGHITDIGIGGGGFLLAHGDARGYDINEAAVRWLVQRNLLTDPYLLPVEAVTLWDSIEHMRDPSALLKRVARWAFISTPIYSDALHAQRSKHYKPGEHLWYFTERGLVHLMRHNGFRLREVNQTECDCGREEIGSFAFERI
jgi:hypothetical protein